jgi:hypothetical protein
MLIIDVELRVLAVYIEVHTLYWALLACVRRASFVRKLSAFTTMRMLCIRYRSVLRTNRHRLTATTHILFLPTLNM